VDAASFFAEKAAAAASKSSGWKAPSKVPRDLDLEQAKKFLPRLHGHRIWYEPQGDRIRCSATHEGFKQTRSGHVGKLGVSGAALFVLKWCWQEYLKANLGHDCPYVFPE